jgi:hypothetical protein
VDVLTELNKFNKLFQSDHVDITHIGGYLNICIIGLSRRFFTVRGVAFGRGSRVGAIFRDMCNLYGVVETPVPSKGLA